MPSPGLHLLSRGEWSPLRRAHEVRVDALTFEHRNRAPRGIRHPVEDFLFRYYMFSPGRLRRWSPGAGVVLAGARPEELAGPAFWVGNAERLMLGPPPSDRADAARRIRDLCEAVRSRAPFFGCFGLHEWAMVYGERQEDVRHSAWPLRLGNAESDRVLESLPVRCTHFDAFRFFTPAARERNTVQPTRENRPGMEQPGCLHTTMDLYRWAYSLSPWVPSDLVLDGFLLGRDVRIVDMRAGPYDLRPLGFSPIPVETAAGRSEYVAAQRSFAARGAALRDELLKVIGRLLE